MLEKYPPKDEKTKKKNKLKDRQAKLKKEVELAQLRLSIVEKELGA
jgi:hypothetical protein